VVNDEPLGNYLKHHTLKTKASFEHTELDIDARLWNFWTAADYLPNHGLDPESNDIYLTHNAWDVRNFVALKTLDAIWRELKAVYDSCN